MDEQHLSTVALTERVLVAPLVDQGEVVGRIAEVERGRSRVDCVGIGHDLDHGMTDTLEQAALSQLLHERHHVVADDVTVDGEHVADVTDQRVEAGLPVEAPPHQRAGRVHDHGLARAAHQHGFGSDVDGDDIAHGSRHERCVDDLGRDQFRRQKSQQMAQVRCS